MRNPAGRQLVAVLAVVGALATCTADTQPSGYADSVFFPTYPRSQEGVYPNALLSDAVVVEESGCLFAKVRDGARYLLLWPEAYAPVRRGGHITVIDEEGNVVTV